MELKAGEVICDKCDGDTFIKFTEERNNGFYPMKRTCDKCKGDGKLDWIENITGKEGVDDPWFHGQGQKVNRNGRSYPRLDEWVMTWNNYDDDKPTHKRSSTEIKERINPNYRKQIERKIAYNLQRR
jgi:hypothetical protein